ncbi:MAG: CRISPR-associated protein Cas5 [Thermodesulfobacteriota bacterium]
MLLLRLEAPFGVFRTFAAGSFRPTAGFITPSAAYGLLLNVAGIEMRHDDGNSVMTTIKKDLPRCRLAIGALEPPNRHSLFQQLHNYPVGNTGQEHRPATKGNKYNITPARRSFLGNLKAYIAMDGNDQLAGWVRDGLAGKREHQYGLPFLGDNNFLIDRLAPVTDRREAFWYTKIDATTAEDKADNVTRLTITIDRAEMGNTRSALFAPLAAPSREIPEGAWVEVGY